VRPLRAADAAAAGLATVASRLGAIPELVVDGTTGYLCSPDDDDAFCERIRELVADEGLRTRMGVAAHRHASTSLDEFGNFDRFAQRLVTLAAGVRTG
jgi:glycosyltransferase involved in cell wall biosynthesis